MTIACPHCQTRYELPETLLGPGGARVRCPRCRESFVVTRDGRVAPGRPAAGAPPEAARAAGGAPAGPRPPVTAPAPSQPAAPASAAAASELAPIELARAVLDELAASHGPALDDARVRGRLFSEHGDRLMEAFEAYRRRAGRRADPGPFREALRERFGVDLTPARDPRESEL
jgi:predicted Zn finger-like uncharacterized protein